MGFVPPFHWSSLLYKLAQCVQKLEKCVKKLKKCVKNLIEKRPVIYLKKDLK